MSDALRRLSVPVLRGLVSALAEERVPLPCSAVHLSGIVPDDQETAVAEALNRVGIDATPAQQLARLLGLLADERARVQEVSDRVDLVWSGPEAPGSLNRDTAVVVRELFEEADNSVLIASYVLDGGEKARAIFAPLAARLDAGKDLDVRLFVNIERRRGDPRPDTEIVAEYAREFREHVWPGEVLPTVYFDPRALDHSGSTRASLHAKCIVIDERIAFVTSANFTEAAQLRNIEVGAIVRDARLGQRIVREFNALVGAGVVISLPC